MSKRTWKRIRHCGDPVSRPAELDEGPHHSDSSVRMFSPLKSLLAKVADLSSFSTSSFSYLFLPQCSHLNWLLSFLIYAFPAVAHPHHNFTVVNVSGVLLFSQKGVVPFLTSCTPRPVTALFCYLYDHPK